MERAGVKGTEPHVHSQTVWYILWSALLIISAVNALAPSPIFSGNAGFLISLLLATFAWFHIARGVEFLSKKEAALALVLLVLFGSAQLGDRLAMMAPPPTNRNFDFSAYYLAAKVLSANRAQGLYDLPLYADGRMNLNVAASISSTWHSAASRYQVPFAAPFIYPPFFAILMKPLAHLSFSSAAIAWNAVIVLLLAGAVLLSMDLGGMRTSGRMTLILGVGAFSYYPIVDGLHMGQIDCLIFFLLAASFWLLAKNRTVFSALSLAVATLIKLTPVIAIPLLIIHRHWRWLAAYFAWLGALLIFSVWQAGWAVHEQFWHSVLPRIACGAPICENSSLIGYVQELYLGRVPDALSAPSSLPMYACAASRSVALAVYCLMLVRFYLKRTNESLVRDLILMALLGISIAPIAWWHYYTIALLPFIYLWGKLKSAVTSNRLLPVLFIAVGTNIVGYFLLLAENHMIQLVLAAIVPCLTIALVYFASAGEVCDAPQASGVGTG